jgi:putative ABC transport system permease protein
MTVVIPRRGAARRGAIRPARNDGSTLFRMPWARNVISAWAHGLGLAVRGLSRAKTFYATAVLTLAIGMAGATVMFTLIRGILLRPLPVPDEARLVVSWRVPPAGAATHIPYRSTDIEAMARDSAVFERVTGVGYNGAFEQTWEDRGRVLSARTAVVMGEFFDVAGVVPMLGRGFRAEDDRSGAAKTLVLSFGAWQRLFGGAPDVIGRPLMARGHGFTIVGVMPADFEYPRGVEIWTTRTALADTDAIPAYRMGLMRDVEMLARLRPGQTIAQASSGLRAALATLDAQAPAGDGRGFANFPPFVRPFKAEVVGDIDTALIVLVAAVGLILAIAGANVANLLLMRGEARRNELVVRAALGASRGRLIGQLVAESLVVALVAGVVGLALSHWSLDIVTALVPNGLPRIQAIRIDGAVVGFTVAVACLTAAVAGLVPALAASRIDLVAQLRAGGRGAAGAASARGRRVLVAAQVALAVTVVAAAGLLGRSLQRLQSVEMGLAADRVVFAELDLPRDRYADGERRRQFFDAVVARVVATPAFESVAPLNVPPFAGATGWEVPRFTAEGQTAEQVAQNPSLNFEAVYGRHFATLGVPIVRGRAFTDADRDGALRVAIVSDRVAAAAWPGQDAIGKRIKFGGFDSRNDWLTVVGVAVSTRYRELVAPRPTLYIPAGQFMNSASRLAIRTTAPPAFVAGVVGDAVRAADPAVRVTRIAPYAEYLRVPLAWPRFNALLLAVFATAALVLSAIGLYGVMAASVRQRHGEIGVRLALGATPRDVRVLVLGEGLRLAIAGAVAGLALAFGATRALRGLLFETEPLDPPTLLTAAAVLVGAALLATYLPARRATRVDPVEALRAE